MTPDLTDDEIDAICAGYRQNAAKVRFLQRLGIHVDRKPNGRPLVARAHYEAVRGLAAEVAISGVVRGRRGQRGA